MNKTFKKVLSIVLSLAMVATSITVYNTTAKAADGLVRLESTADITGISDVNTEAFVSTADSAQLAIPHAFMGFLKAGVDHDGWGRIPANSPLRGQMVLALAVKNQGITTLAVSAMDDNTVFTELVNTNPYGNDPANINAEGTAMWDGDCIAIPASYFDIGDAEVGNFVVKSNVFEFTVVVKKYVHVSNTELHFTQTEKANTSQNDSFQRFKWDLVDDAVKYVLEAQEADGTVIRTWDKGAAKTHEYWCADVPGTAKDQTYNMVLKAYDASNNVVATETIEGVGKYFLVDDSQGDVTETAAQDPVDVDAIDDWTVLAGETQDGAKAYVSAQTAFGNDGLRGLYAAGTSTNWNISDNLKAVPVFGFVTAPGTNASAVIIDGVRYVNSKNNTLVYVGNDCVYINQELLKVPDGEAEHIFIITAEGSGTGTFALRMVAPISIEETAPDQTLDEVTDWVEVSDNDGGHNTSVAGTKYYVSEAFKLANFNYVDLFGLYDDDKQAPYVPATSTIEGASYVSAMKALANTMVSVWVDGVKYANKTPECFLDGDQIHISQNVFALPEGVEEKVFAVTIRTQIEAEYVDYTYAVKVAVPQITYYNVTVDGTVTPVVEGDTFVLPAEATYGYFDGTAMYKAGTEFTVTSDMAFTSVNDLSVTVEKGAGIRLDGTAGIRFQAKVNASEELLNSGAITEGMLITANDLYEANDSTLDLTSAYTFKNIVNSGWYNGAVGTYCGSIVNIVESNYIRNFIAKAYATVKYTDGTTLTIYSGVTGVRSISGVANAIIDAGALNKFTPDEQAMIQMFAAAK